MKRSYAKDSNSQLWHQLRELELKHMRFEKECQKHRLKFRRQIMGIIDELNRRERDNLLRKEGDG